MNDKQREKILKALTQQARRAFKQGADAKGQNVSKFGSECVYHDGYVSLSLPSDLVETKTVLDIRTKRDIDRGVECIKLDDTTSYPYEPYESKLDNYKSYEYSVKDLLYYFKDVNTPWTKYQDGIIKITDRFFEITGFSFIELHSDTFEEGTAVDVNYLLTVLKIMDILGDKKVTLYLNTRNRLNPIMLHSESVKGDVVPKLLGFSW
mgnify:CR=1 FL=1